MVLSQKCSIETCTRNAKCRGWCETHYYRHRHALPMDRPIRSYYKADYQLTRSLSDDTMAAKERERYKQLRLRVLEVLGNKCIICGYDENPLGIDIDHINNDGGVLRRMKKGSTSSTFRQYLANNCEGLQLLCGTCHNIKSRSR